MTFIHPSVRADCELCGDPLDSGAVGTYQWTSGWVQRRKSGGAHAVACPVRERRFAHRHCVHLAAMRQADQASLF